MVAMRKTVPSICYRERVSTVRVVIIANLLACTSRSTTPRERALAQLPGHALVVAAADGPALSRPAFRRIVDATRARVPTELGCVVDVALTSEAVAVAVDPQVGTTIVVVTRAFVGKCALLSKVGADQYVATLGGGTVVTDRKQSVLVDPQWGRARDYLLHDPVAIAAELPEQHMLGVAQPDPLDGWFTIDAPQAADAIEKSLQSLGAEKLRVKRKDTQLLVTLERPDPDDVILLVTELARRADSSPSRPAPVLTCVTAFAGCKDGAQYTVPSVPDALRALTTGELIQVIGGGDVAGLRVVRDTPLILRAGDLVLGIGPRRVTSKEQLADLIRSATKHATLAFRRDGIDYVIELRE